MLFKLEYFQSFMQVERKQKNFYFIIILDSQEYLRINTFHFYFTGHIFFSLSECDFDMPLFSSSSIETKILDITLKIRCFNIQNNMNLQVRDRENPKSYFYKPTKQHLKEFNDFNVKVHDINK